MGKPHKFVSSANPPKYGVVVWCEWCGTIIFYDNQSDNQEFAKARGTECPNSQQKPIWIKDGEIIKEKED